MDNDRVTGLGVNVARMDERAAADNARMRVLTAKAALERLTALVVGGELMDGSKDSVDLFAATVEGITGQLDAVAGALDALSKQPGPASGTRSTGRRVRVSLDLLDRATQAQHELVMLSEFASCAASARVTTKTEGSVYDAVSLTINRVSHTMGELIDAATELNGENG